MSSVVLVALRSFFCICFLLSTKAPLERQYIDIRDDIEEVGYSNYLSTIYF